MTFWNILILITTCGLGFTTSAFLLKNRKIIDFSKKAKDAENMKEKSKEDALKIIKETKERVQKRRENIKQFIKNKEGRISKLEESLKQKSASLRKKEDRNNDVKLKLASYKEETQSLENSIKRTNETVLENLSKKTGESASKIKEDLLEQSKKELELENAEKLSKREEVLKEGVDKRAKKILIEVIQRVCSSTSVERRAVNINVPKDHIKGKIVGKDGRNILAFEESINVDIIFNDMPNNISISAFNLVDRRIAEVAMLKLVKNKGEITPELVKKLIKDAERDTDEELYKIGKNAIEKMKIKIESKELIRTIGRLQYRTSYGQNIMKHSMEVAWVCRMLGSEIGLNEKTCLRAGFLHDIGKAIDQDPNVKDCHDQLSKEIMEKYDFSEEEVHAAWAHHDAVPIETAEALLVKAADAVSASRPGARQESFEKYIERMKDLERTAKEFNGVKRAFAISAGRELRVIVDSDKVNDKGLYGLAKDMAGKIKQEIVYPGKVKVNVIRKTKHTETAR